MSILMGVKIDVTKIDKKKLFKGEKGTYLNMVVALNDEPNEWGDVVSVWEQQTEEERRNKEKKVFLGGGRIIWQSEGAPQPKKKKVTEDDVPF